MPADEGHGPQLFFRQDAELEGQRGKDYGRVHVRRVVGGVDGDWVLAEILGTTHDETGAGEPDAAARPNPREAVLNAPTLVPERREK